MTRSVSAVIASAIMTWCASPVPAPAQTAGVPTSAANPLLGLWGGGEMVSGPAVRGEIIVEQTALGWNLRVAGYEAAGNMAGDSLVISLPGGQGTLRAWLHADTLEGYWMQPSDFDGPSYATPIRFARARAAAWIGTVVPIDSRFPLYLHIARSDDTTLLGVFRNPGANWPGRAGSMRVERDGDALVFINTRTGKPQYRQPYDSANGTIVFDFGVPLVLTRRTAANAVGYFPRSTALLPYTYRTPLTRADGWKTTSAQHVGLSESALRDVVRRLATESPLNDTMPRVHALVVARHGALVLDEYFYGYGETDLHDLRSASKTMTSVMAGAAMLRGAMLNGAKFDMSSPVDTSPSLSGINLGHLLTHSSGLACNDDDENSPGNEDRMQSQTATDWYRYTLNLPRVHAAGRVYAYCSAGINLVGRTISAATKQWLPAFFDRTVAQPLQITHYGMNLMPTGEGYAAGGMRMRPRDLLKFGQLYLNQGVWQGTRIVSADWVRKSTGHQIDRPDGSTDGFGWHRHVLTVGTQPYQTYEAGGNGGQFVVVIPELDLVIATTAGNYGQFRVWEKIRTMLVPEIMRAVR